MKWLNQGNGLHAQANRCQKAPQTWPIQPLRQSFWKSFPGRVNPGWICLSIDVVYIEFRYDIFPIMPCICSSLSPSCWTRMFSALVGLRYGLTWAQGPFNLKFISQLECWGKLSQGVMRYGGQGKPSCLNALLKGRLEFSVNFQLCQFPPWIVARYPVHATNTGQWSS